MLRAALVCGLALLWAGLFWFQPLSELWGYRQIYAGVDALVRGALELLGFGVVRGRVRWAVISALLVALPVIALWIAGRPPRALGLGKLATHGWRIVAAGFVIGLPFLIYVGLSEEVQRYYASFVRRGGGPNVAASAFVVLVEHVYIEGLVLALALPSGGLHPLDPEDDPPRQGRLAWLGFGLPGGQRGLLAWLGVPAGAWPALIGQALLFGLVHAGKASAEFWTAFPGGLGLGVLTYRIRSVWPSVLLHLGTGAVILLVAALAAR